MALQCRSSMSSNFLVFHTSGGISSSPVAFLFLIFRCTESISSWVYGPSLMSNYKLIIPVISSCITFGGFLSKFSKCCFHRGIRSCWWEALSLALVVFFLLLTSFIVCHAILDCLSSTESLILSIWFVFCLFFRYMLANSFFTFLSFRELVLVRFFQLHLANTLFISMIYYIYIYIYMKYFSSFIFSLSLSLLANPNLSKYIYIYYLMHIYLYAYYLFFLCFIISFILFVFLSL